MSFIDTSHAWRIIRDARRVAPTDDWRPEPGITISPGGRWSTTRLMSDEAAMLFDTLLPIAYGARRHVIAQIGQSLDGRIATANGNSHYMTGNASRVHLHRLRALVDAVIVGASTAAQDDPQLTVRHVEGENPARVVLDPNGRVAHDRHMFTDGGPAAWHAVRDVRNAAPGAIALPLTDGEPGGLPRQLLDMLNERGLRRVLVEGGGTTISRFIDAGLVDRLHIVVAPLLVGSGRLALNLAAISTLDSAIRPVCRSYPMGDDRLYDLDLRARAG